MSLFQWKGGSRMFCGSLEGVVELLTPTSAPGRIGVKVRGPPGTSKLCFYFLEELLGVIDQVQVDP